MCHDLFTGLHVGRQFDKPVVDLQMEMYKQIHKNANCLLREKEKNKKRTAGKLNVKLAPVYTV